MAKAVIICGDRNWPDEGDEVEVIASRIEEIPRDVMIILGGGTGADEEARLCCVHQERGHMVIPAEWAIWGNPAGPIRNKRMLSCGPSLVIAFHDYIEKSRGSKHMVNLALKAKVPAQIIQRSGTRWQPEAQIGSSGPGHR